MITLSNDSDIMDTSLEEQISIDRKANILSDAFLYVTQAFSSQHPGLKKVIRDLQNTFCYWTSVAGDMSAEKADELLDDISTDGKRIDSEKIAQLVKRIQPIVVSRGLELDPMEGLQLIENDTMSS